MYTNFDPKLVDAISITGSSLKQYAETAWCVAWLTKHYHTHYWTLTFTQTGLVICAHRKIQVNKPV